MYEDLERLNSLREKGAITEDEFQREKKRILDNAEKAQTVNEPSFVPAVKRFWGMDERSYCAMMHVAQFAGIVLPLAGFVLPIVMWQMEKDNSENVNKHGKMIVNWMISLVVWSIIASVLIFLFVGVPLIIALLILNLVFVVKGAIAANKGEFFKYPMTLNVI